MGFGILVRICTEILNSTPNKSVVCLGRENANVKDKGFGFFNLGIFLLKPCF